MCLEALAATEGVEHRVIGGFWEVDQDGAWVIEEPYDVASENVTGLLDFTKSQGTIKEVVADGGSDKWGSG